MNSKIPPEKLLKSSWKKDFQQTVLVGLSNVKATQNICDTKLIHNYCDKKLWDNKPLMKVIKKLSET
ncbi:hypothetical protein ERK18_03540 [Lactobacillus kimbladii]|uniref:hypothetical protein n=1 Tax=Lactobacillus kimbladii TaxID=1218506 RepID=UPI00164F0329|nr:hypothetical protein [Lactobacillus kimbladii]MBC6342101.1 hypothetical protein [Lactobacillus kimbladii]